LAHDTGTVYRELDFFPALVVLASRLVRLGFSASPSRKAIKIAVNLVGERF
jgi:hypothetical protein